MLSAIAPLAMGACIEERQTVSETANLEAHLFRKHSGIFAAFLQECWGKERSASMRTFTRTLCGALTLIVTSGKLLQAAEPAAPVPDWWSTVEAATEFTAVSRDGSLKLKVKLAKIEVTERTAKSPVGEEVHFFHNGVQLPSDFWPGRAALVQFELIWNGRRVPIADRFWRDLYGFRIQTTSLKASEIADAAKYEFEIFSSQLDQPRVILSADGGTALIEWQRPEECDSHTTYRWLITKDGRVLRHCDRPPHEC